MKILFYSSKKVKNHGMNSHDGIVFKFCYISKTIESK